MALTPVLFYSGLASARAATPFPFLGFPFDQLAWALAYGLSSWVPTVSLLGLATGTSGTGFINPLSTRLILPPNPPLVIAGLLSAGMSGPLSQSLGLVVGQGVAQTFGVAGQYSGGVAGCGNGADVSRVVRADPVSLSGLLHARMNSILGAGPAGAQMASGLGTGIANMVLTCTGTGIVSGPSSPTAGSGHSVSFLV